MREFPEIPIACIVEHIDVIQSWSQVYPTDDHFFSHMIVQLW
jgi:hypothetical protein